MRRLLLEVWLLGAAHILQLDVAMAATPALLDMIVFGDSHSEAAHQLSARGVDAATRPDGTPYRAACRDPASCRSGWPSEAAVTFRVAVDPDAQNYFTAKFDGSQKSVRAPTISWLTRRQIIKLPRGRAATLGVSLLLSSRLAGIDDRDGAE